MSVFYTYICSFTNNDTGSEMTLQVGDVFGKPWYAWEKYFTIDSVYHCGESDSYDWFFTATIESGKSISELTQYFTSTFASDRKLLTTWYFSSRARIAGIITLDGSPFSGVSILEDTTTGDGKYFFSNASAYTGTATPAKTGYDFTPESVDYSSLVGGAIDNYTAELALPEKPINPAPADAVDNVVLDQETITWEDGGGATSYDVYYGTSEAGLALVSSGQTGLSFIINGITNGSPFGYSANRFWRIDAVNAGGTTTGDVWIFRTVHSNSFPWERSDDYDPDLEWDWDDTEGEYVWADVGLTGGGRYKNRLIAIGHGVVYFGDI